MFTHVHGYRSLRHIGGKLKHAAWADMKRGKWHADLIAAYAVEKDFDAHHSFQYVGPQLVQERSALVTQRLSRPATDSDEVARYVLY